MLLLLIGTTAFYLAIGDLHEGLLLAFLTVFDLGIVVYQDLKTERVLESLRDLASPRALVIRDRVQRRIPGREVVPDDVVIVAEGDRVPADAELLSAHELKVDELLCSRANPCPFERLPGPRLRGRCSRAAMIRRSFFPEA